MFQDRVDAGRQLAHVLVEHRDAQSTLVLGIPRGGVIVAAEVARELGLPLGVALAAKVGAPGNPEYAVGAVAADGVVTANPSGGLSLRQVEESADAARQKIAWEAARWCGGRCVLGLEGATAILVDDGLATGLTAMAAADWVRREGAARIIVAVPVAPRDTVTALAHHADEVVVVEVPPLFSAVGQFYRRFGQTTDDEVDAALAEARTRLEGRPAR